MDGPGLARALREWEGRRPRRPPSGEGAIRRPHPCVKGRIARHSRASGTMPLQAYGMAIPLPRSRGVGQTSPMTEASGSQFPSRKRPAHFPAIERDNRAIIVYLTLCADNRRHCLASPSVCEALIEAWTKSTFWLVGRYVILPDHLHLFCAPGSWPPTDLGSWISFWKRKATIAIRSFDPEFNWQREHWDRQLRSGESYDQKWDYVRNNPVRHKYVDRSADWPYQGELNVLPWHD